jgi:hypothetical protein
MKKPILLIDSKLITLLLVAILIIFSSTRSDAQSQRGSKTTRYYRGFQGSFGRHSFKLASNLPEINRGVLNLDGGQIGFVLGNDILRLEFGLIGYYSATSNVGGSIDFYTNHAIAKFYPLSALSNKRFLIEPYFAAGISFTRSKFFGDYASADQTRRNNSVVRQEYVGAIRQLNSTIGAGFEVKVVETYDFVHLFTEIRYGHDMHAVTNRNVLSATSFSNHVVMNIGITFGRRK